jgi:hypothetical protein
VLAMQVEVVKNCSILAAVGQRMASTPGVSATLFTALAKVSSVHRKSTSFSQPLALLSGVRFAIPTCLFDEGKSCCVAVFRDKVICVIFAMVRQT